jgi:VPDSG-CTERM motif
LGQEEPSFDKRGVDLISDALPLGRLWYGEQNAIETRFVWNCGSITLQTPTPNGVIPPIDQFALNDFVMFLDLPNDPLPESVLGHLTSLPTITGLVPDSGTTVTLLSCALLGMAALRRCLRDDGKS